MIEPNYGTSNPEVVSSSLTGPTFSFAFFLSFFLHFSTMLSLYSFFFLVLVGGNIDDKPDQLQLSQPTL
jgi:hypothetical protein